MRVKFESMGSVELEIGYAVALARYRWAAVVPLSFLFVSQMKQNDDNSRHRATAIKKERRNEWMIERSEEEEEKNGITKFKYRI